MMIGNPNMTLTSHSTVARHSSAFYALEKVFVLLNFFTLTAIIKNRHFFAVTAAFFL